MDQLVPGGRYVVLLPLGTGEQPYATIAATKVQERLASEGAEVEVIGLASEGSPLIVELMAEDPDFTEPLPVATDLARERWLAEHPRPDISHE